MNNEANDERRSSTEAARFEEPAPRNGHKNWGSEIKKKKSIARQEKVKQRVSATWFVLISTIVVISHDQ